MPRSRRKGSSGGSIVGGVIGLVVLLNFVLPFLLNGEVLIEGLNALLGGLFLLGIFGAAVWVAWRLRRRLRTPTAQELARRFEAVRSMSGAQFEVFVADLFKAMGHQAVVLGGADDQGVDVIVTRRGERVAVQCKNYKKSVGNKPVQEVFAGARHHRCAHACVVAPAGYTKGATDLARSTGVSLFDAQSIRQWIRQVDEIEEDLKGTNGTESDTGRAHIGRVAISEEVREAKKRAVWHTHLDDPPMSQVHTGQASPIVRVPERTKSARCRRLTLLRSLPTSPRRAA